MKVVRGSWEGRTYTEPPVRDETLLLTFGSAKSGSDWSTNELLAYNITVQRENAENFSQELGPIDHLDPNLFSSANPTIAADFSRFLVHRDLASRSNAGQESAIDGLTKCPRSHRF